MMEYLSPMREKYFKLIKDEKYLKDVLADGAKQATKAAEKTMEQVRELTGLSL